MKNQASCELLVSSKVIFSVQLRAVGSTWTADGPCFPRQSRDYIVGTSILENKTFLLKKETKCITVGFGYFFCVRLQVG